MKTPPNIVIIGRPNVGKSLLFNRLLGKAHAIVHRQPGMTLDFLRLPLRIENHHATLADTGGSAGEEDNWTPLINAQMQRACDDADYFLFITDARSGCISGDTVLANALRRRYKKPWWLVVNKAEHLSADEAMADFHQIGAQKYFAVSAKTGFGLAHLQENLKNEWLVADESKNSDADSNNKNQPPRVAIVGRANVGKSTFVNRLIGQPRMAVCERPGTTRDSVSVELRHPAGNLTLIDTAGMKRKRAVSEREKMSVSATRRTLAAADIAVLMFDIAEGVTMQDKRIAALIAESGSSVIAIANKKDLLTAPLGNKRLGEIGAQLLPHTPHSIFLIGAQRQKKLPVTTLLQAIRHSVTAAAQTLPTHRLNDTLTQLVHQHPPPRAGRIRPKLRYAHQGGNRPLTVIIHGNATDRISASYTRYLSNGIADAFALVGVPLRIIFRNTENPYA